MMKKLLVIIMALILSGGIYVAYETTKLLNELRCLGCIAMLPKTKEFKEFWIEYPSWYKNEGMPEHPEWIINASADKVVMLFFWGPACRSCEEQWEDMKKAGMVNGSEENGRISKNFSFVAFFSINVAGDEKGDAIRIYTKDRSNRVPTTVILFQKNGIIYWYAFSGKADGKGGRPTVEKLKEILELAKEEKNDLQS